MNLAVGKSLVLNHGLPATSVLPMGSLFEQALRTWVASLRYVPEEIDGAPVATRVAIPVDFSMGGPGLREYRRQEREARQQSPECKAAMGAEDASPSQPVVLDSPFRPVTTG